jgi:hypothetical protein
MASILNRNVGRIKRNREILLLVPFPERKSHEFNSGERGNKNSLLKKKIIEQ